jgi:AraC-like DNA-binding protein
MGQAEAIAPNQEAIEALGIRVERHRRPATRLPVRYGGGDLATVIVSLSNTQMVERVMDGRRDRGIAYRGTATVVDPAYETHFVVDGEADIVKFFLPVADLRAHMGGHVRPLFAQPHRDLERLAYRIAEALTRGEGTDAFVVAEVLSALADPEVSPCHRGAYRGGLAPAALARVLELIEHGVEQPRAVSPSVRAMASEADLSMYHFAREFVRSVGMTPHQYALRRRLERARNRVVTTAESIQSISGRYGFASPSHFVQRFRAEMGLSPARLRALIGKPIVEQALTYGRLAEVRSDRS